ncbi:MAG: hypothetical protein A3H41_00260 [Omnitrophica WOR_2 bacterium RIFCSPLOWO2_02_FULL_45_28]|nr:MAG: hypothetical protein A3H41_00260 [Omnitrophica WOR_2 bacterium RIFCSPLOWO2_02_FULL_45_28]
MIKMKFSSLPFSVIILSILFCFLERASAFDEKGWKAEKSTHFIVYYKEADEKFIRQAIDKAEEYYKSIAENLGFTRYDFWLWDKRAKIYIYNDAEDYRKATGKPSWSGGAAYYHEKVIESYPWAQGFFQSLLPHELGHIIFREFVGSENNAPLWLDEGVAMYQEKVKRFNLKTKLLQALEQRKLMPLNKLSELNINFVNDKEIVELYYAEALSVVDYLLNKFGRDNFVELCRRLKERKTFDQAINDAYRVFKNLEDLNKAWLRHIKE